MLRRKRLLFCGLLFCAALTLSASADSLSYNAYTYNEWQEAVASPSGYEPEAAVDGLTLGVGALSTPTDLFYCKGTQKFYILDSGNNRVIVTDKNLRNAVIIDRFQYGDGFQEELDKPEGLFVAGNGDIYIADTTNFRIVVCDQTGLVKKVLVQPRSSYFSNTKTFAPTSVVVDSVGTIYAACKSIYNGAVMLDGNNNFLGFFGSNKVTVTPQLLLDRLWKSLLSKEAREKLPDYIPVEMTSLAIGNDDFIYTCTLETADTTASIRKINPYGKNILQAQVANSYQGGFGDLKPYTYNNVTYTTRFGDIAVDDNSYTYALDDTTGRVFTYDNTGNLMFVFGGTGNQSGLFVQPSAVEAMGGKVYVLDGGSNSITVFRPTQYGETLLNAEDLYREGQYQGSLQVWQQVLRMNSNYNFAYIGIGKAYLEQGDYSAAMHYFRLGSYKSGYSDAFKEARSIELRRWFPLLAAVLVLVLLAVYRYRLPVLGKVLARRRQARYASGEAGRANPFLLPLKMTVHPLEGYAELYYKKQGNVWVGLGLAVLLFFVSILSYQYYGFLFTDYNKQNMNILFLFVQTILLLFLFAAINWAFTTLFDGKGRLADIWIAVTYALIPLLVTDVLRLLLSNLLLQNENIFLTLLTGVGYAWTGFLVLKALEACHQYSMKQVVFSAAATIAGICIVAFVFVLLLSLTQQIVSFIATVVQEYSLRAG